MEDRIKQNWMNYLAAILLIIYAAIELKYIIICIQDEYMTYYNPIPNMIIPVSLIIVGILLVLRNKGILMMTMTGIAGLRALWLIGNSVIYCASSMNGNNTDSILLMLCTITYNMGALIMSILVSSAILDKAGKRRVVIRCISFLPALCMLISKMLSVFYVYTFYASNTTSEPWEVILYVKDNILSVYYFKDFLGILGILMLCLWIARYAYIDREKN